MATKRNKAQVAGKVDGVRAWTAASFVGLVVGIAGALFAVVGVGFLIFGTAAQQASIGTVAGPGGVLVSAVALLVAVLIYVRQERSGAERHDEVMGSIRGSADKAVADQAPAEDLDEPGSLESDDDIPAAHDVVAGATGRESDSYDTQQIPLRVIADLVEGWEKGGLAGAWTVGQVIGASRPRFARNRSWYVYTQDETHPFVIWRVSKGGKGVKGATVTKWRELRGDAFVQPGIS